VCQFHKNFLHLFDGHSEFGGIGLIHLVLLSDRESECGFVGVEYLIDEFVILLSEGGETFEVWMYGVVLYD
jgi:hypothetical protein